MNIIAEEWRDVKGAENRYQISSLGRVKSLARVVCCGKRKGRVTYRTVKEKILKTHFDKDGYAQVLIAMREGDRFKTVKVHALVAAAFLGPKPEGTWVLHGPNGKKDNSPSNLYYGTPQQNSMDKWRDGTVRIGEIHHKSKLKADDILAIRQLHSNGTTMADIAKIYQVNKSAIQKIIAKINWGWL